MIALALRTWVRYLVPLTLLAVIACAPLLYVAFGTRPATDYARARMHVRLAWGLAGSALAFQLLAVAAMAPAVRAVAAGAPLSQLRVLATGLRGLVRGLVPWLVAITAVVLGGVALVVPGALLVILLALTGASDQLGTSPQAALADSVAIARTHIKHVALLVLAVVVVDLAIVFVVQQLYVPVLAKKVTAAQLVSVRATLRVTALALAAWSALPACLLAALYSHAKRR